MCLCVCVCRCKLSSVPRHSGGDDGDTDRTCHLVQILSLPLPVVVK